MPLIDLTSVEALLICPRCGSGLARIDGSFRCSATDCPFGPPRSFETVEGMPVFVDFERSVVQLADVRGVPDVRGGPDAGPAMKQGRRKWSIDRLPPGVRSLWKPRNSVAARNVEQLLSLLPGSSPLVLVVGGGTIGNGVEAIYTERRLRVVAFDIVRSRMTQFVADAHQIPLADESVDAVVIQAVLEHVLDPDRVVEEIERVLRPRGVVYAETPFLQQVHAGAYDFVRYTSSGHRYLFRAFEEVASGPVAGPGTQLLWSVDHLVRGLLRSELAGKVARGLFFWLRFLDRLVPASFAMDSASAYYFLGRRADRELTPHEIVEYYRGAQRT